MWLFPRSRWTALSHAAWSIEQRPRAEAGSPPHVTLPCRARRMWRTAQSGPWPSRRPPVEPPGCPRGSLPRSAVPGGRGGGTAPIWAPVLGQPTHRGARSRALIYFLQRRRIPFVDRDQRTKLRATTVPVWRRASSDLGVRQAGPRSRRVERHTEPLFCQWPRCLAQIVSGCRQHSDLGETGH
jgi:hypothetical protein